MNMIERYTCEKKLAYVFCLLIQPISSMTFVSQVFLLYSLITFTPQDVIKRNDFSSCLSLSRAHTFVYYSVETRASFVQVMLHVELFVRRRERENERRAPFLRSLVSHFVTLDWFFCNLRTMCRFLLRSPCTDNARGPRTAKDFSGRNWPFRHFCELECFTGMQEKRNPEKNEGTTSKSPMFFYAVAQCS